MTFKKGQSGNPGGRPKEKPFMDALRMEIKSAGDNHKKLRQIAKALLSKAAKGDIAAIREVADRFDGKPSQALSIDSQPHREMTEFSDDELLAIIQSKDDGVAKKPKRATRSNKLH